MIRTQQLVYLYISDLTWGYDCISLLIKRQNDFKISKVIAKKRFTVLGNLGMGAELAERGVPYKKPENNRTTIEGTAAQKKKKKKQIRRWTFIAIKLALVVVLSTGVVG